MSMLARTVTLDRPVKRARRASRSTKPVNKIGSFKRGTKIPQSMFFDPFPSQLRTRMRYVESVSITSTLGSTGVHYFSCNGIHDPDITGTGHQPYGHDQVAALYNHYSVKASRIRIVPHAVANNMLYGVTILAGTTIPGTQDEFLEKKNTVWKSMTNATTPLAITLGWKQAMAFPAGGEGKNLNASYGSNPGEQMFFAVFAQNRIAGSAGVNLCVQIEYDVLSYEMKDLPGS